MLEETSQRGADEERGHRCDPSCQEESTSDIAIPTHIALEEVERIFVGMGYEVVDGPEVEYDLYNFRKAEYSGKPSGKG